MEKNQWTEPKVIDLGVEMTEHGDNITSKPDDHVYLNGYTYYSFS